MVYKLTNSDSFTKDFGLRDQIQRAAVSSTLAPGTPPLALPARASVCWRPVPWSAGVTNIAEGFDCESKAEFARFLGYSRRSAVEVQSLLYAAFDIQYISETEFKEYYEQARKAKALIGGFKHSLKR
jgi:23S rRNA-intervening sequence protein